MPILLLLSTLLARADAAPHSALVSRTVEVRRGADVTLPVVLELRAGERIWIMDERAEFTRVRIRRGGRWKQGFVFTEDLASDEAAAAVGGDWAVGFFGVYSQMGQSGRQFQTEDGVIYRTSAYASTTFWPAAYVQYRRENFWRLSLALRQVHYRGTASANVGVANTRRLTVDQTMYSGRLEKAFSIYKQLYLILGGEVARGTQISETLGGITIPTNAEDLSIYAGGSAGLGASFRLGRSFTVSGEGRYGLYPSLKPTATAAEALLGAAYWF